LAAPTASVEASAAVARIMIARFMENSSRVELPDHVAREAADDRACDAGEVGAMRGNPTEFGVRHEASRTGG
jgi:hypothetical protein